jgi:hypothetical protein
MTKLDWRGQQVTDEVIKRLKDALVEFGLRVESDAKQELYPEHGVVTGTLRRSIHTATPGYNWEGDDLPPAAGTPERGNQPVEPKLDGDKLFIQVGSGLKYALWVHQGTENFAGYHFISNALESNRDQFPKILEKH